MQHKNLNAIITTRGGNNYYVSRRIPQVILIHPVLKYLVELKENGTLGEWLNHLQANNSEEIEIKEGLKASHQVDQ